MATQSAEIFAKIPSQLAITDIHCFEIGKKIRRWERLCPHLDITEAEEEVLAEDFHGDYEKQKQEMLRLWKSKMGSQATYCRLIDILCKQGEIELAEQVQKLVMCKEANFRNSVLEAFHTTLKDNYDHLTFNPFRSILSPTSYIPLTLRDITTERLMTTRKGAEDSNNQHLTMSNILSSLDSAGRTVILIEGVAGSGTTLLEHTCHQWAAGELGSQISLLVYVPLQHPHFHNAGQLADILPHSDRHQRQVIASAIAETGGRGVCFLLDSWDEAPIVTGSFIYELVIGTPGISLPYASIVISSRHEGSGALYNKRMLSRILEINRIFISPEVVQQSLSKQRNAEYVVKKIKSSRTIQGLCDLPVNFCILLFLLCYRIDDLPETFTDLFHCFILILFRRHLQKVGKSVTILKSFKDLPKEVLSRFKAICRLAFHCITTESTSVSQEELQEHGIDSRFNFGILRTDQRLVLYGLEQRFSFLHLTIEEFLAAIYISELDAQVQAAEIIKIYQSKSPVSMVILFYAGLTKLEAADTIITTLSKVTMLPLYPIAFWERSRLNNLPNWNPCMDERRQLLALFHCLHEARATELIIKCFKLPKDDLSTLLLYGPFAIHLTFDLLHLEPSDCLCIGWCLPYLRKEWNCYVHLHQCYIGDLGVELLLQNSLNHELPVHDVQSQQRYVPCFTEMGITNNRWYALEYFQNYLDLIVLHIRSVALFQSNKCLSFDLEWNCLTHSSMTTISKALSTLSNITHIDLRHNFHHSTSDIPCTMRLLIEGLSRNTSCRELHLPNYITEKHVYELLLLIAFCPYISSLALKDCKLRFAIPLLAKAFRYSKTLKILDFTACDIHDEELAALGNDLGSNVKLDYIKITCNFFSLSALQLFIRAIYTSHLSVVFVDEQFISGIFDCVRTVNRCRYARHTLYSTSDCPLIVTDQWDVLLDSEKAHFQFVEQSDGTYRINFLTVRLLMVIPKSMSSIFLEP